MVLALFPDSQVHFEALNVLNSMGHDDLLLGVSKKTSDDVIKPGLMVGAMHGNLGYPPKGGARYTQAQ